MLQGLPTRILQRVAYPRGSNSLMRRSARLESRLPGLATAQAGSSIKPTASTQHGNGQESLPSRAKRRRSVPKTVPTDAVEDTAPTQCNTRTRLSRSLETALWAKGFKCVAGVDEAGRGPLAGPVVAAACVIPHDVIIDGIDDSKKLKATDRDLLYMQLTEHPSILYGISVIDVATIDEINILEATMQAMEGAVNKIPGITPDYTLIDGNRLPKGLQPATARAVVGGDETCHIIAAASIIAKVTRDRLMEEYDKQWPAYGFAKHKGYGTAAHMEAIRKHGPCPIHRCTFAPLKHWIADGTFVLPAT